MNEENYWICPWCKAANFRESEGLDECERCGSETRVRYVGFEDRMIVTLAREPMGKPLSATKQKD